MAPATRRGRAAPPRPSPPEPLPDSLDPLEIALDADRGPGSPARELMLKQGRLIDAQLRQIRTQALSEQIGVALKLMTGLAALILAGLLGAMIWTAAHDRSLVITAFATPPDLAARGLTGQVIAAQLMDKLAAIDADATSFRAPQTIRNDWGGDIKVEIPSTGVSISELDRYLRSLLSQRTTIGGELFTRGRGLTLTVRAGPAGARSVAGTEVDLDAMLQKAAEALFEQTQPFRYSKYLEKVGRRDEAMTVARRLADEGPASEKPWAWAQISNLYEASDMQAAADAGRMAVALDPDQGLGWLNLSIAEGYLGHEEAAHQTNIKSVQSLTRGGGGLSETGVMIGRFNEPAALITLGDARGAATIMRRLDGRAMRYMGLDRFTPSVEALSLILAHDLEAARKVRGVVDDRTQASLFVSTSGDNPTQYLAAIELGDWAAAEAYARGSFEAASAAPDYISQHANRVWVIPRLALAMARNGRTAEAAELIGRTPLDCYRCLIARGQVAAAAGDSAAADRWFLEAARQGPSLPQAQLDWARALVGFNRPDAAITQLAIARARGPRYPDVASVWGEALMKKGDAKGAVAQFRAAGALAPKWGHNHLLWGDALAAAGKASEARVHWKAAQGLPLSKADRVEVERLLAGSR